MGQAKQTSLEISEVKNIEISLYKNCREKNSVPITIENLLNLIRTGEGFRELIKKIRDSGSQIEKDELKKLLPAVTLSGLFGESRKKENLINYSGLIQIDLDKIENLLQVRGKLEKDKYIFALFISPSGNGLKLIIPVFNDLNNHGNSFLSLESYFLSNYGLQIDKSCKDITRLMFLSCDETLFINEKAIVFPENKIELIEFNSALNELNKKEKFEGGNRNNFIFKLACLCSQRGVSQVFTEKEINKICSNTDFGIKEIKDAVRSAFNYPSNASKNKIIKNEIEEKKENKNKAKIKLIEEYINSKYELRSNEVSCKIEFRKKETDDVFEPINENNISRDLQHNYFDFSINKLKSLLNSDFVPVFNPFKDYFESFKEWDANTEIDFIDKLCQYIPVKNADRLKKQFKKMLVRSIACSLEDTVFNKQAFILVHDQQNSGKSTFCRWLCPPSLKDYIAENINTDKDSQIALATNFLINMDELATLSRMEINALKSFLSKDKINVRLPYESRATVKPRRANFIGSTNKDEFLTDETGSVRWLCFELTGRINFAYKSEVDINDVWRQAYALYKAGFEYQLTPEEVEENETVNRQYLVNTPEMDLIPKHYKPGAKESNDEFATATDIQNHLAMAYPHLKLTPHSIGKALKILGFIRGSFYNETTKVSTKGYYVSRT